MNVYFETFGCTFNQADSQIMAGLLDEKGFGIVNSIDDADIIILNTCYVKKPTEQKIINRIQKIKEEYPDKKLIVSGCMVDIDPVNLEKHAPNSGWIGSRRIESVSEVVESVIGGDVLKETGQGSVEKTCLPKLRSNDLIHIIQICEGCLGSCNYCCTRFARGSLQSYPIKLLKKEAEEAIADGCVEIQLTAQDTAAFGKDTGETLSDLINEISSIKGDFRVRVGMMHPQNIGDDLNNLIDSFKHQKVYNFLHLPLQSGNDIVLSDMDRGHSINDYLEIIGRFKAEIPGISLATDIIVGYPTENEKAFQDTLKVIDDIRPDFLHISKYNHRPGTTASFLKEIDYLTMKKRSIELNKFKEKIANKNNERFIETVQKVLITDKGSKGGYIGRTDSYKTVVVDNAPMGTFITVKISEVRSTYLKGKIV